MHNGSVFNTVYNYFFGINVPQFLGLPYKAIWRTRIKTHIMTFMIMCDLVAPQQVIGDNNYAFLRSVHTTNTPSTTYLQPYQFRKVCKSYISDVEIIVRDTEGLEIPFLSNESVAYTLLLRQKPKIFDDDIAMSNVKYLQLTSNACTLQYPNNNPGNFTNNLPDEITLTNDCNDWEVGIATVQIPKSWQLFSQKSRFFRFRSAI